MPAVSLPPKENALFKRILVSLGRRADGRAAGSGSRGAGPVTPQPGRAGTGPPRGDPAWVVLAGRARPFASPPLHPGGAHLGPRAPRTAGLRRPGFRTRPRRPGFHTAACLLPCWSEVGGNSLALSGPAGRTGPLGPGILLTGRSGTLARNRWCGRGTTHSLLERASPSAARPSLSSLPT